MFDTDIARQGMRFMTTLALIAEFLDDPERLGPALDALTRAHARVGVRAAHFAPMGSALLVTLGETLGPEFTCRLQEAWRAAYDHFAQEMIARGGFT
jgi:hemoglobin-like flavoprotein